MPKLWNETIDAHRAAVRKAVLETTAAMVAEHGLTSVTMSRIAKDSGIGRATLYKYFPDVESILLAWHEQQVSHHLDHLAEVRDGTEGAAARLEAVLREFALISRASRQHHDGDAAAFLHRDRRVSQAQQRLHGMVEDLLADGARSGDVRDDIAPGELASYCLHALTAAGDLPSEAAVHRLVTVTIAGVRPGGAEESDTPRSADATARSPHHPRHHPAHGGHSARS
ncbi:putative HTH-type transcriptional regulator [Streptomyces afghaniensis 772]|uniref:Putative HTH-type transcriptional regulator n=1 Tax=Streptomyces afghaniensis 772 TaxID=1283301 RepID=S4MMA0_9ACTN|nr:TetR/AcrR family transcriptional regulator [Streptomyces afghaniensis]EPJ34587.1 putative HTH-type transcriptional regulator [Streptomyces afghaniensis 772]